MPTSRVLAYTSIAPRLTNTLTSVSPCKVALSPQHFAMCARVEKAVLMQRRDLSKPKKREKKLTAALPMFAFSVRPSKKNDILTLVRCCGDQLRLAPSRRLVLY